MARYAEGTDVDEGRSKAEIERTLRKYGADQLMLGWQEDATYPAIMVEFRMQERRVRLVLPVRPKPLSDTQKDSRNAAQLKAAAFAAERRRIWRVALIWLKTQLELLEDIRFEDAFLAHTVLPSGQTAGDWLAPQIERAYLTGNMPALLPARRGQTEELC